MKANAIPYHHWIEWSDEDQCYIGFCPDLFLGGVCHGEDEEEVYSRLIAVVREEVQDLRVEGKPLPAVSVRPMRELVA
ncbi:MAG: pilus assembly protein HicB [Verrucomicrobiaceae bacterium]|jgi:predicted RNase H-like HicB family nuclease